MKNIRKSAAKLGFTLIELSIVLVIIGLIVGGILVGQDLIKAAEIRATVSQLEKYSTAVNTFRSKYNGIPGDLLNASNFGFDVTRGGGTNGNSVIETYAGGSGTYSGESACFWDDLTYAGMIPESLNTSGCGTTTTTTVSSALPAAKMGRSNYVHLGSNAGVNYYALIGVTSMAANLLNVDDLLTGSEAFQIDSKIDDGGPTSGSVQAVGDAALGSAANASIFSTTDASTTNAAGVCIVGGVYNFQQSSGNDQACMLRIRASF